MNSSELKSEIEYLQNQLTESIENENNDKLKIKELEIKNSELEKKNFEYQSKIQDIITKQNIIKQEDSNLKFEIKKLKLGINSPGKVLSSLSSVFKGDISKNIKNEILLKDKIELKEENEKLLLEISEKESEIVKIRTIYEQKIDMLQKTISELYEKISDIKNELRETQDELNKKIKEYKKIEENKNIISKYNLLKLEFEQYKKNIEKNKNIDDLHKEKRKDEDKINKNLKERIIKIENNFSELIKKGTIIIKEVNNIDVYLELNENLRSEIMEMQDKSDKFEKKYEDLINEGKEDYKKMEEKYIEYFNKSIELQSNIDYLQNSYVRGTVKLNTELSELKSKVFELEKNNRLLNEKFNNLLANYEKVGDNLINLQQKIIKFREKDNFDINLIEERYIILENMLNMEKNDLITQNKDLINQVRLLIDNGYNTNSEKNVDINDTLKMEIKNLKEENKLLQNKLKDKDNAIIQLQQKLDTFKILQEENQSLKASIKENNINFQEIISELTTKKKLISEQLLESRKRPSVIKCLPKFNKEEKIVMNAEIEKYKKENENLEKEISNLKEQNQRNIDELSTLKTQIANDSFIKENEIFKYKSLAKKYRTILEENGLIKK